MGVGFELAPVNDTAFNPFGQSWSYVLRGTSLHKIDLRAGSVEWTVSPFGSSIPDSPAVVLLSRSTGELPLEFVFVTAEDGRLHKINADDGVTGNLWVDTRRSTTGGNPPPNSFTSSPVCATDQLRSSPVVQLYNSSNAEFKERMDSAGHAGDDLVFVASYNQCSDQTHNTVKAYYASDLTLRWVFNNS